MAKSSKGKVIQMLSPENYIRQKARTLPVYECMVNNGWEESQLANLVVARQHTNGNITAGLYLVDLSCLGIKDTTWFFNISVSEYRENIERFMLTEDGVENIDYVLAHNIVHAGLEFADDYEFKPHKDFTSVTQFILDEENDDIPLIEIECGFNGLPAYMQGPLDNDQKSRQVIAQLERVAGPGNYYLIDEDGEIINDIDDFDEDVDDLFSNMTFEEKSVEFLQQYERLAEFTGAEIKQFFQLHQSIINDMVDDEKFEEYYADLMEEMTTIAVDDSEIPDGMMGIEPGGYKPIAEVKEKFWEVIEEGLDLKKIKRKFKLFKMVEGVDAAINYFDIFILGLERSVKFESKIKAAMAKYPNYALLQIEWAKWRIDNEDFVCSDDFPYSFAHYFKGRDSVHSWEYFNYIDMRTHYIMAENNLDKLEAWKVAILEFDYDEVDNAMLYSLITMFQIGNVLDRLKTNH